MPAVQHIDEEKLDQDIAYRFQFLSGFMGFTQDDIAVVHESAEHLAPLVPGLVDAVYDKLFQYDATKRHFVPKQHGFSGPQPENLEELDLDHEQIAFRKKHLSNYLVKLVTSEYDGKLLQYLDWVGKIHTPDAGNAQIVVPLVQINALMGFVNDALIATIQGLEGVPQEKKTHMIRAFTKLLWIQEDLFTRHYVK
jgi:hypothetical protein